MAVGESLVCVGGEFREEGAKSCVLGEESGDGPQMSAFSYLNA